MCLVSVAECCLQCVRQMVFDDPKIDDPNWRWSSALKWWGLDQSVSLNIGQYSNAGESCFWKLAALSGLLAKSSHTLREMSQFTKLSLIHKGCTSRGCVSKFLIQNFWVRSDVLRSPNISKCPWSAPNVRLSWRDEVSNLKPNNLKVITLLSANNQDENPVSSKWRNWISANSSQF